MNEYPFFSHCGEKQLFKETPNTFEFPFTHHRLASIQIAGISSFCQNFISSRICLFYSFQGSQGEATVNVQKLLSEDGILKLLHDKAVVLS